MRKLAGLISFVIAFILAIIFIHILFLDKNEVKFDEVGLGEGTFAYFPKKNGLPIHIDSVSLIPKLIDNADQNGKGKDLILWLGNSQLFGVNQYKSGQKNSVEYLFDTLATNNKFVLAYSLPNANLEEHLVVFKYLISKLTVKQLLLPVFFDDTRESGLREDLIVDELKKTALQDTDSSELSKSIISSYNVVHSDSTSSDMKALDETTQENVEKLLNQKLSSLSDIWAKRADSRSAFIYYYIYKIRNSALGITPDSKRKKIIFRYNLNMEAFSAICKLAKKNNIKVLVYVPPIRNDVEQPYIADEYQNFKTELLEYQNKLGFTFYNAENIVPAKYWGMKGSTTLDSKKLEVDFMHFQSEGHRLIADSLASIILKQ